MVLSESLRDFINNSFEYLNSNKEGFQGKLSTGDYNSIKLLLDLALKIYEIDKKFEPAKSAKNSTDKTITSGENNYGELFNSYKDDIKD